MSDAIENGDVELWTTPLGKWFPRVEMMAKALEIWPMHVIEEALGDEADGILPQAIRSVELRVRLPRHHIDRLHYRADQQETTVSGVLERELDGWGSPRRWRGRVIDETASSADDADEAQMEDGFICVHLRHLRMRLCGGDENHHFRGEIVSSPFLESNAKGPPM